MRPRGHEKAAVVRQGNRPQGVDEGVAFAFGGLPRGDNGIVGRVDRQHQEAALRCYNFSCVRQGFSKAALQIWDLLIRLDEEGSVAVECQFVDELAQCALMGVALLAHVEVAAGTEAVV